MAPDVLYVNFRKSDNYIQNSFLYPLDKPDDGYLTAMTQDEIDFRIIFQVCFHLRYTAAPGLVSFIS